MDPTKSGDAVRMTPGGQITSDMADPTNDDLPSTSSSNPNHNNKVVDVACGEFW